MVTAKGKTGVKEIADYVRGNGEILNAADIDDAINTLARIRVNHTSSEKCRTYAYKIIDTNDREELVYLDIALECARLLTADEYMLNWQWIPESSLLVLDSPELRNFERFASNRILKGQAGSVRTVCERWSIPIRPVIVFISNGESDVKPGDNISIAGRPYTVISDRLLIPDKTIYHTSIGSSIDGIISYWFEYIQTIGRDIYLY